MNDDSVSTADVPDGANGSSAPCESPPNEHVPLSTEPLLLAAVHSLVIQLAELTQELSRLAHHTQVVIEQNATLIDAMASAEEEEEHRTYLDGTPM